MSEIIINMPHVNRENIDQKIYFRASILEQLVELKKVYDQQDEIADDSTSEDFEELININSKRPRTD